MIKNELDVIKKSMKEDSELAWTWHCNIAMAVYDTLPQENYREKGIIANNASALVMRRLFDVEITTNELWKLMEKRNNLEEK